MTKFYLWITMVALVIGGIPSTGLCFPAPPMQTNPDCAYIHETGFYICDEFRHYFEQRGGTEIFGYPITRAFDDPTLGMKVQYFQRARMELHPENPAPYTVLLGLLIDELGYPNSPAISPDQAPSGGPHFYFPETGHVVSYAFWDYFRTKGGLDTFGYPRTEFLLEDGRIVQYFQRARMEWHPEAPTGSPQIRLTNVGEMYVERFRATIPAEVFEPESPPNALSIPQTPSAPVVTNLHVSASVKYVITGRTGGQTVFVYATDQQNQPIQGAQVKMVIHYPSGDQLYTFEDPTNDSGFADFYFNISPTPRGQKVVIGITVTYNNLTATTQTFFIPWW